MSGQAVFTLCIRPDCPNVPRYCSIECGQNLESGSGGTELEKACTLLRRAAAWLTSGLAFPQEADFIEEVERERKARLVEDIGAFLARVRA